MSGGLENLCLEPGAATRPASKRAYYDWNPRGRFQDDRNVMFGRSMPWKRHQCPYRDFQLMQPPRATQVGKVDDETGAEHVGAQ